MFKFMLPIATSVVLLMSGAADLFAMEPEDTSNAPTINYIPEKYSPDAEDASKTIFWRWGNDTDLSWGDYLTADVPEISSRNLLEKWRESECSAPSEPQMEPRAEALYRGFSVKF